MEKLLFIYIAGIAGSVFVGFLIVHRIVRDGAFLTSIGLPPGHAARIRVILKILGIAAAAVGCLSAKFYGCDYSYDHLLGDPVTVTWKVLGQFEATFRYLLIFFLVLLSLHIFITLLAHRRHTDSPQS